MLPRRFWTPLLLCVSAYAAGEARSTPQSTLDLQRHSDRLAAPLGIQFQILGAQALQARHPEMARKLVDAVLEQLRAGKDPDVGFGVIRTLVEVAPRESMSTLAASPDKLPLLIDVLVRADRTDDALTLYRSSRSEGKVGVRAVSPLIGPLTRQKPAVAAQLFQESVAAFRFDDLEPWDAWWLITTAGSAEAASPRSAADLYERILTTASAPAYGEKSKSSVTATFQVGAATVSTSNSRDTLLLAAAARLHRLAPERLAKFKPVLSAWDLTGAVTVRGYILRPPGAPNIKAIDASSTGDAIRKSISQFRGLPTDADRASLAIATAAQIRSLPGGAEKLSLARGLSSRSTEGDLGKEALTAVTMALAQAIRETKADSGAWLDLASLVRYERLAAPYSDPALDAANAVLTLRETVAQESGFTLTALDGKTYSLPALRGRVVLLNFWATWCPPCRKEMPDMEKLYRTFEKKGFIVLAVSDEERDVVTGYLAKENYTFPVLLDPGRKAHTNFSVDGIPKTFLFDREGKLVAESMDMRTERQFLEMLKLAGLE